MIFVKQKCQEASHNYYHLVLNTLCVTYLRLWVCYDSRWI